MPLIYPLWMVLARFWQTVRTLTRNPETRGLVYLVVVILLSGMVFYHYVEGWRWLDALYFSVITLTTVGYGDFAPKTDAGKLFTIVYIFIGLGILAGFITAVAQNQSTPTLRLFGRGKDRGDDESPKTE